jgi:hypothetical protein
VVITVICPSRGNPKALFETLLSFRDTRVEQDSEFVAALDENDPSLPEYLEMLEELPYSLVTVPRDRSGNMNLALNYAAEKKANSADILGFMGDDHRFRTTGWDRIIGSAMEQVGGGIVYGDDLAQREALPTQVFVSSSIVRLLGWFGLRGARHLYLDNTWKMLGDRAGCLYYMPDVVIEHMHPAYGKGTWDPNHVRVNTAEMYDHDRAVYEEWLANDADVDVARVKALLNLS